MKKPLGSKENDAAFNLIKAAEISNDTPKYAITISPPQEEGVQIDMLYKRYLSIIKKMKCWYELYPELDKTGRLHFHGIVYKNNPSYNLDLELLRSKIGFICVKEITNRQKWLKYCKKEFRTTKKLLSIYKAITPLNYIGDTKSYDIVSYYIEKGWYGPDAWLQPYPKQSQI